MKRWLAFAVVFALGLAALIYCQKRPVEAPVGPGPILYFIADSEHELSRLPVSVAHLSDAEEIKIGDGLARQYSAQWRKAGEESAEDRVVRLYVEQIGGRVAARAHRKLPYKVHFIPDMDFVNAFALPGGHVVIGAGMMALMDSEDELAAVLGHEIEHIDHFHCAERVQTQARLRKIPLGELMGIPVEIFEAGYAKDQELEADREGTRLAVWAGYSPLGAIRMFETCARLERDHARRAGTPQEELSQVAWQVLEGYFSSHPLPSERIAQIKQMISEENWGSAPAERNLEVEFIFLTRRAKLAIGARNFPKAAQLAAQSLGLKPEQAGALAVLSEAKFALADYSGAAAAYGQTLKLSLKDGGNVTDFAAGLAQATFGKKQYGEAAHLAEETLKLQASQTRALGVLGDAKFALADFQGAAAAYRKLLDRSQDDLARVADYAAALSAEGAPQKAAAEFGAWIKTVRTPTIALATRARIEQAGLNLLAGNTAALDRMLSQARGTNLSALDTDSLARLGWWCYRAGKYPLAADLLNSATQGLSPRLDTLGWVLVEQGDYQRAVGCFNDPMGKAVAWWRMHAATEAMADFAAARDAKPEWLNPRWVKALYSPRVEQCVGELETERVRRVEAARHETPSR